MDPHETLLGHPRRILVAAVLVFGVDHVAVAADAPAVGAPDLTVARHVIASGGGESSGGQFEITGTIGQPDADPLQPSTGGTFAITGGFWPAVGPLPNVIFRNGFEDP